MKIAISGKGGVGKTTLAALLAQVYAEAGRNVLAADADPSPPLAWQARWASPPSCAPACTQSLRWTT